MSKSPPTSRSWVAASLSLALSALLACQAFAVRAQGGWKSLRQDDGITTWSRDREGSELPVFRSRVSIDASVWRVLAVLDDVERACEWTAHCAEMRRVRRFSDQDMWVYARIDAPWPVRDRDVLTRVRAQPRGKGEFVVRIDRAVADQVGEVDGVVRMPEFRASYTFRELAPSVTEVTYEAAVDPGGALPAWLKRLVARDFPHDTLSRLRERVLWSVETNAYLARAEALRALALSDGYLAAK